MIVRILNEGQYELSDDLASRLEELDHALYESIQGGDEAAFDATLRSLLDVVRDGTKLDPSTIVPSDLTLPHEGSTIPELRELLASEPDAEAEPAAQAEGA